MNKEYNLQWRVILTELLDDLWLPTTAGNLQTHWINLHKGKEIRLITHRIKDMKRLQPNAKPTMLQLV